MKYILPIGHGKEAVFPKVTLDKGLFVSGDTGGDVWNPLESGRTYVEINPFFRSQKLEGTLKTTQQTSGLDIALQYDNTNYRNNPTQGSYQRLFYSLDPGINGSNNPWQVLGFEAAKYIPLGPAWSARERVLAFNLWTVDCLSWNDFVVEGGQPVYHRPPSYKGANLGGLWRMKGFAATRFHDRAALYYGAEYRHTLDWNPLSDITFNGRLKVDWFQVVGFTELGRVAPSWSVETLHKDMKWTAGIGLRAMVNNITLRADLGISEEDHILQLFIGYPF
jgi:outer membrane protein assembly factor BamA